MDKFEIGEVAVLKCLTKSAHYNGRECEIVSAEYEYCGEIGYDAIIPDDPCHKKDSIKGEWFVQTEFLRKKQPPQELSTWEAVQKETGWNPTKQGVIA